MVKTDIVLHLKGAVINTAHKIDNFKNINIM